MSEVIFKFDLAKDRAEYITCCNAQKYKDILEGMKKYLLETSKDSKDEVVDATLSCILQEFQRLISEQHRLDFNLDDK